MAGEREEGAELGGEAQQDAWTSCCSDSRRDSTSLPASTTSAGSTYTVAQEVDEPRMMPLTRPRAPALTGKTPAAVAEGGELFLEDAAGVQVRDEAVDGLEKLRFGGAEGGAAAVSSFVASSRTS